MLRLLKQAILASSTLFCTLFLLTSCSSKETAQAHSFRVYVENGVTISESAGSPKYSEPIFQFEELFELEQDETRPETLLYVAAGYLMDDNGQIFVFDYGDCRVAVFDRAGKYLRDFGRRGPGPGEFSHIRLCWMKEGKVAVYDALQYRASIFTTDGRFLESYTRAGAGPRMLLAPVMRMLRSIYPLPDGRAVQMFHEEHNFGTEEQARRVTATLVSSEEDSLRSFNTELMETPAYPSKRGGVIHKMTMFTTVPDLQIYLEQGILIADAREPVVSWYGFDGGLERVLRLGLEPEAVTDEERGAIERYFRNLIRNAVGSEKERLEETWQYTVIPDFKSYWSSLLVDDYGFYWLRNHDNWTQSEELRRQWSYKVFSPEGEYLGSATWPSRVASITRGHFMGRHLDEETGGYRYVVYRIRPAVEGLEYP